MIFSRSVETLTNQLAHISLIVLIKKSVAGSVPRIRCFPLVTRCFAGLSLPKRTLRLLVYHVHTSNRLVLKLFHSNLLLMQLHWAIQLHGAIQ